MAQTEYNPEIYFRSSMNDPLPGLPNPTTIPGSNLNSPSSIMNWISPSSPPNGVITQFTFSKQPKYCSFNGLNQFLGVGYTQTQSGNNWLVTFIDVNSNTITPQTGDEIHAETA